MLIVSMTLFYKLQRLYCIICSLVAFSHLCILIEAQKLGQRKQSGALQYYLCGSGMSQWEEHCEHFTNDNPSAPRCCSPCSESHRSIEKYSAPKQVLSRGWKTIREINLDLGYCSGNPKKASGSGVGKHLMWYLLHEGCKKNFNQGWWVKFLKKYFSWP